MSEIAAIRSAWARKYVFDRPGEMVRDQDADIGFLLARIEALENVVSAKQNIIKVIQRTVNDHLDAEAALAAK